MRKRSWWVELVLSGCQIFQDLEILDGFLCPVCFFPLSVEELKELFLPLRVSSLAGVL